MPLDFGWTVVCDSLPQNLASQFVERVDLPGVSRIIFNGSHISVQAIACLILGAAGHCRADEDLITPNHRTGMSKSGNGRLPTNIF